MTEANSYWRNLLAARSSTPIAASFPQSATASAWEEVERRSIGMQQAIEPGGPIYALEDGRWYRLITPSLKGNK